MTMKAKPKPSRRRKRRRQDKYSPEFIGSALVLLEAYGGNILRTARDLHIPETTLRNWVDDPHRVTAETRDRKTIDLIDATERLIDDLAGGMRDLLRRGKGNMRDAAIAFGIAVDKLQLLRQLPTSYNRTETVTHTVDWSRLTVDELQQLLALQAKVDGTEPPAPIPEVPEPVLVDHEAPQ